MESNSGGDKTCCVVCEEEPQSPNYYIITMIVGDAVTIDVCFYCWDAARYAKIERKQNRRCANEISQTASRRQEQNRETD